ncbi:MAG TPA: RNA polymerase sigma-I factor [Bacillota bacterium]|nr:RNA polymerase sigma-I factor [Peptococcaceae bacterium MAG4]NLW37401.1 RNA polymerase sigma-I factor [Peptococcaceae bacterium]HPZ43988.1 RNA polymerase sigma-I factor [Bacillota bacterium]HQD77109.1 RNA polymerase sigma-I factor [Bacillota bacterium]HUM59330.1 RNA polymerase sigma-I factor [Bacillota bacterium]
MFPAQDLDNTVKRIKQGDQLAREDFLESYKPFIFKAACKFCKRGLDWGRDDELAIALIAFNEAIDRYREDSGVPFLAFARLVIVSRLKDYFRRENRADAEGLSLEADRQNNLECARSWEAYLEEEASREREEEIKEYEVLLSSYGVTFEDLVKCSPRHRSTRLSLLHAAQELANSNQLLNELKTKKKLPLIDLEKITGVSRKTLERGRKYIIAMALLISKREEYLYLSSYLILPSPAEKGVPEK